MPYLDDADYPSIRQAIDLSLDATRLPDAVIAGDLFAGSAEDWAAGILGDPPSPALTDAQERHAKRAVVLYTASIIIRSLPNLTDETLEGTGSYTRKAVDTNARSAELAGRAAAEIALAGGATSRVATRPTSFAIACGRRGR